MAKRFLLGSLLLAVAGAAFGQDLPMALKAQADRIAAIEKVRPTTVAIFAKGGRGGGTGVLISDDGYALTNFHVVQPTGPTMQCGLPDGILYDAVIVGLDKVGDVALIKLLPKQPGQKFPVAVMGDSDTVREGDWSIAMGNPFLLATDFTPTVTFGLISGVHRYQYPAGLFLEYTDCIQIDTPINPGNSGGPLFNMKGELIGINGRGSFDKRGRVNSGVGYAISINQIKNFLGHMKAGIDTDHASLGAEMATQTEGDGLARIVVQRILEESDAYRRGMDVGDELVSFAGRPMGSANQFLNVLGLYPRGWRVPLEYRRDEKDKSNEVLVRLMGKVAKITTIKDDNAPDGKPVPIDMKKLIGPQGPAAKYYQAKPGFANYYFNKQEKSRLMSAFAKTGDFTKVAGDWVIDARVKEKLLREEKNARLEVLEVAEGKGAKSLVKIKLGDFPYELEPLKANQDPTALKLPEASGGLTSALYLYHRFMTMGEKGFDEFNHGGVEPLYPPADKDGVKLSERRVLAEVLKTQHGPFLASWYFDTKEGKMIAFEVRVQEGEEPCEVYLSDYRDVDGRQLPHKMAVWYAGNHYATFTITKYALAAAK
jgi:S1-C subfamily serine protease